MREEGYHYGQIGAVVRAEALAVGVTAGIACAAGLVVAVAGRRSLRPALVAGGEHSQRQPSCLMRPIGA